MRLASLPARRTLGIALELLALLIILAAAAQVRLANNAENPGWYTDETTHIDIARRLLAGEMRYLAVDDSTLLFARVPLFHLLLAGRLAALPDADAIAVLRGLTGALGVATVALLYAAARRRGGAPLALLAAGLLAVYPQAVIYSRFGFSYNLVAPLVTLTLLGLVEYSQTRRRGWLALAALAVGLGVVTDLVALTLIPTLVLCALAARRPRDLLWSLPLLAAPSAVYALVMLARAPDAFLYDLAFTLTRLNPHPTLDAQWTVLVGNYRTLLQGDLWFPAGVIGLFLLRPGLRAPALLLVGLPLLSLGRTVALYSLSAYYLIPFLPLLALGAAGLVWSAAAGLWQWTGAHIMSRAGALAGVAALALVVGIPLAESTATLFASVERGFATPIDSFLMRPADARAAAAFVNERLRPGETVVASPVIGWLVRTDVSDFQMTAAYTTGLATPHLPAGLPSSRWAFDPSLAAARFAIVDPTWSSWGAVHVLGVSTMLGQLATWPVVFETGMLRVYANPRFSS